VGAFLFVERMSTLYPTEEGAKRKAGKKEGGGGGRRGRWRAVQDLHNSTTTQRGVEKGKEKEMSVKRNLFLSLPNKRDGSHDENGEREKKEGKKKVHGDRYHLVFFPFPPKGAGRTPDDYRKKGGEKKKKRGGVQPTGIMDPSTRASEPRGGKRGVRGGKKGKREGQESGSSPVSPLLSVILKKRGGGGRGGRGEGGKEKATS